MKKNKFQLAKVHAHPTPNEALKMLRELQGLTQEELARRSGINQSNLSALETNQRQMGRERALILAKVLKVHPAVLLFPDFDISEIA